MTMDRELSKRECRDTDVVNVRLNGGYIVHGMIMGGQSGRHRASALCGKTPGGGQTRMGRSRSRWVGTRGGVTCGKCLEKIERLEWKGDAAV